MDPFATPMISDNTSQNNCLLNDDNTPIIINGKIQDETAPNFFLYETNYDALPTVISQPLLQPKQPKRFVSKLWENQLYINRIKKNPILKKVKNEIFPELSIYDMIFVYYNYLSNKDRDSDDQITAFNAWSAPDHVKTIVKTRISDNKFKSEFSLYE
tara:strand:- start:1208 stop:1678 length:471 start_codon:yes stop_codon:yes gene_type:complete